MRFAGTITIPVEAFEKTLESAARSFRLHGFKDIVFLGDHGGYRKSLARVAARLDKEWAHTSVRVHAMPESNEAQTRGYAPILRSKGYSERQIGVHAGLADTSLTLAIDPALVRTDRLDEAAEGKANGVHGDPRESSAALGRVGVDLVVETAVAAIRKAAARR
jgi:creatinine amidohydrolase/Fe(II)-dependent formamide hydrolase-like protein